MIKLLILDRDSTLNHGSSDPASPFYYIRSVSDLVIKPTTYAAMDILGVFRRHTGLKVVLATKQRCISNGLVDRATVDEINEELQARLAFTFDKVYVEESAETKADLFAAILRDYPDIRPDEVLVIDDSMSEVGAAKNAGCKAVWTSDLHGTICSAFSIT